MSVPPKRLRLARLDREVLESVRSLQPEAWTHAVIGNLEPAPFFWFWRLPPRIKDVYASLARLQEYGYVRSRSGSRSRTYWFVEEGA